MNKKLLLPIVVVSLLLGGSLSQVAVADAAKPKLSDVGGVIMKHYGSWRLYVNFQASSNTSALRVVVCSKGLKSKKPSDGAYPGKLLPACKGKKQKVYKPKKLACKPNAPCKYWGINYKTKKKRIQGYVVASNSDGVVKRTWNAVRYN